MTSPASKPALTLRDGAIKATIWKNQSENGEFYSVTLTRTYKDVDCNFHDVNSFTGAQNLQAAQLHIRAHAYIGEICQSAAAKDSSQPSRQAPLGLDELEDEIPF